MAKLKIIASIIFITVVGTVSLLMINPGTGVYEDYLSLNDNKGYNSKSKFNKEFTYIQESKAAALQEDKKSVNTILSENIVPEPLDDISAITEYVNNLPICEERRNILLSGLSVYKTADYSLTPTAHNNWSKDSFTIIECSGFVAWCYNKVGLQFGAPSTASYKNGNLMVEISNEDSIPGDIGHVFAKERGKSSGHVGIYLGKVADGRRVYIHAGSGKVPTVAVHADLDKRTWRITEIEQFDNSYRN